MKQGKEQHGFSSPEKNSDKPEKSKFFSRSDDSGANINADSGEESEMDINEDADVVSFDERIEALEAELKAAKDQSADYLDKLQRAAAEFENFRRRNLKEKDEQFDNGIRTSVLEILPAVDNFERALQSVSDKDSSLYKGVIMVQKQITSALENLGVTAIPAVGNKFDPNIHAAVAHANDENFGESEITAELMKGYKHRDKVIRHSMVNVAN